MASAQNGRNPASGPPARQQPARKNSGRATNPDPTFSSDQVPSTIFGQNTALTSTGLGGSAMDHTPNGVTEVSDQSEGLFGHTESHGETSLDGTSGSGSGKGGQTVTYTDPFAYLGGVVRDVTTTLNVETGTEASNVYGSGPQLPGIAGNMPSHTGLGHGSAREMHP